MECRQLTEWTVDRLAGALAPDAAAELSAHLRECPACRAESEGVEAAWTALGQDPGFAPSPEFLERGRELVEDEMLRMRVRAFRPKSPARRWIAQAAAVALAAGAGYAVANRRSTPPPAAPAVAASSPMPNLESNPRLSNLSYQRADSGGRVGIGFDVTARYQIEGAPGDPEVNKLLAYVLSHNGENAGEKSRAIELLAEHGAASPTSPVSPDIVAALTGTLRKDTNPGVRKKAADALAAMPMTPEIRSTFLEALRSDRNPAVRLVAIEALSAAAKDTRDPRTIQTLREKAVDPSENGFVRTKAASALKTMEY